MDILVELALVGVVSEQGMVGRYPYHIVTLQHVGEVQSAQFVEQG